MQVRPDSDNRILAIINEPSGFLAFFSQRPGGRSEINEKEPDILVLSSPCNENAQRGNRKIWGFVAEL